jgi:hypothetical protein
MRFRPLEDVCFPRRHVKEEAVVGEVITVAFVAVGSEKVAEKEAFATEANRGEGDVTLGAMWAVIDGDEESAILVVVGGVIPGEGNELMVGVIVVPGGTAVEELPAAVLNKGLA